MKLIAFLKYFLVGIIALAAGLYLINTHEPELATIHKEIQAGFQTVEHINADEYVSLDAENVIVFDTMPFGGVRSMISLLFSTAQP